MANLLILNNIVDQPRSLEDTLSRTVDGAVYFDRQRRALYATDASNYRQVPIAVVEPKSKPDVEATIAACRAHDVPILSRGGGTSLAGQCCNVAVVLDFSKHMNRVLEIDPVRKTARVQPGTVLDRLREAAREHDLDFGPDPATHDRCTIGGMLGNDSCGVHSLLCQKHGRGLRTSDNTSRLEILTYRGERSWVGERAPEPQQKALDELVARHRTAIEGMPKLGRRVSGFHLDALLDGHVARALVGTESTCVTILEAELNLVPAAKVRRLVLLGYPNIYESGAHLESILEHEPIGLEGIDQMLVDYERRKGMHQRALADLPSGDAWLLVEFAGETADEADEQARALMERLDRSEGAPSMKLVDDPDEEARIWAVRKSGLGATAFVPGDRDRWPGWEDAAVPPRHVGAYLRDFQKLMDRYDYRASIYGHFGQGCIHCRIDFGLETKMGIDRYRAFIDDAADLVLRYDGSLSGEHGDGQARGALLEKMYGAELVHAFEEFKSIWDPDDRMNPGKVVRPHGITDNLRLGTDFAPREVDTHFAYPDDRFDFSRATMRCVGVGACRSEEGGTMCPSWRVTHDEQHSTRGRAHLLFEMMTGDLIDDGWQSEEVKSSLDLCLACKGCKSDCPVDVDVATYKAEFLSHYYERHWRPRQALAFGFIHHWARLASIAPPIANFFTQTPGLADIAKWAANIAPERSIPPFAPETFTRWYEENGQALLHGHRRVVLFADTFNDNFHPETARSAANVLNASGYSVEVPRRKLCCGRPLYDFGYLKTAKRWLRRIINELREPIRAGVPIVVLEPSCAAVLRDEALSLLPHDRDAKRLAEQVVSIGALLGDEGVPNWRLSGEALYHGHCHQKSLWGVSEDVKLVERLGLDVKTPDSGCCGMAGAFGFERGDKYDVSMKVGEKVLLPTVREAEESTYIIADGFSCRTQISAGTNRTALHIADVLDLARRRHDRATLIFSPPESEILSTRRHERSRANHRWALGMGIAGLAATAVGLLLARRK